jgi:hypothetical protein
MSKEIMDNYDAGHLDGLKLAYALVGKLADFYKNNIVCGDDWPDEEKREFFRIKKGQENACRYAQHVIRTGTFRDEEELPW